VKEELALLHENFVFVPTDKAQNNISIVCKKFFIESLLKEVGFDEKKQKSLTYQFAGNDAKEIVQNHEVFSKKFQVDVKSEQFHLPFLFCIPKMHKKPSKFR
jgi:hypothetical protein